MPPATPRVLIVDDEVECRRLLMSGNATCEVASPGVIEVLVDKPWNGSNLVAMVRRLIDGGEVAAK